MKLHGNGKDLMAGLNKRMHTREFVQKNYGCLKYLHLNTKIGRKKLHSVPGESVKERVVKKRINIGPFTN